MWIILHEYRMGYYVFVLIYTADVRETITFDVCESPVNAFVTFYISIICKYCRDLLDVNFQVCFLLLNI